MNKNYTQEASNRCFAFFDKEIEEMWDEIAIAADSMDKEQWKTTLGKIESEFAISSRFALMRLCQQWACPDDGENEYQVIIAGKTLHFSDFTFEHAANLDKDELRAYEQLLLNRASTPKGADQEHDRQLIRKALAVGDKKKRQSNLTRGEALKLGHILNFSLEEMQWFLLRALDMGEGFRFNSSEDLIEAYGFLTKTSWQHIAEIKKQYAEETKTIQKNDFSDKPVDWTQSIALSLPEMVTTWTPSTQDEKFLDWMISQSPYLDTPSKTATRIYRDLAVYVYNLITGDESWPADNDFVRVVREIVASKEEDDRTIDALWDNGTISKEKCEKLASILLLENLNFTFSDQTDKAKPWHYLKMKKGRLTASGGIDYLEIVKGKPRLKRTRVQELLSGSVDIEKGDMLYLLWFLANLCWFETDKIPTTHDAFNRLADFIDASEICLDLAMLPGFYPPHALEQSMMLSIVYGGISRRDPAEIYEEMCASVILTKAKPAMKKKK